MRRLVCVCICGEKYEKVFSCYLRKLVLFYSLRLEKIVLQFNKVCTVFLPLGIFQDNLVPVSEVNLFKPLHAKITQALSGTKYRFSYGCCTDWQSLA